MEITAKQINPEETVLIFSGQLDFIVRKELQLALQSSKTEGAKRVVLDLTEVTFIDCAALGILVKAKHELAESQTTLSVIAAPGKVFDVLHTMNLDQMMTISPANQEILAENARLIYRNTHTISVPDAFNQQGKAATLGPSINTHKAYWILLF